MDRRRRALLAFGVVIVLAVVVILAPFALRSIVGPSLTPAQIAARAAAAQARRLLAAERAAIDKAADTLTVRLPSTAGARAPITPTKLFRSPLKEHEVIGFVPYYSLSTISAADLADTSVVCYFGLQLGNNGAIVAPKTFIDLTAPAFTSLVTSAHAAGDRVLLTLSSQSKKPIDEIARHPVAMASRLASELASRVLGAGLDGVDIDLEGRWSADRNGFARFVAQFSTDMRTMDPTGEIVLDTYPESASGNSDFFDVASIAPHVDELFVMAYDMEQSTHASANSPAADPELGLSAVQTLIQYTKVVPAKKIVLGLPFYGLDFSTLTNQIGSLVSNPIPEPVTYAAITTVGRVAYWDPASKTPYTRFRLGTQFHETWFDDPLSIGLKTALANDYHLAGVGVWTLGMEGSDTAMLSALTGQAPVVKLPIGGKSPTS